MADTYLKDIDIVVGDSEKIGGIKSLDINNNKIPNVKKGTQENDAVNLGQITSTLEELTTPIPDREALITDRFRRNVGYGKNGKECKYWSITDDNVNIEPDLVYASMFAIQRASSNKEFMIMLHKDLLSQYVQNIESKNAIGFVPSPDFMLATSAYSYTPPDGGIVNYQGGAIPDDESPNNPLVTRYLNSSGQVVNNYESASKATTAAKSCYFRLEPSIIQRGNLRKNGTTIIFTPDISSDWFIGKGLFGADGNVGNLLHMCFHVSGTVGFYSSIINSFGGNAMSTFARLSDQLNELKERIEKDELTGKDVVADNLELG